MPWAGLNAREMKNLSRRSMKIYKSIDLIATDDEDESLHINARHLSDEQSCQDVCDIYSELERQPPPIKLLCTTPEKISTSIQLQDTLQRQSTILFLLPIFYTAHINSNI